MKNKISRIQFDNTAFFEILDLEAKRKAQRRDELCSAVIGIPVSNELLEEIAWLSQSDRDAVLRHHPGYPMARKMESLWSVLKVFERAHADLSSQLERFRAFSLTTEMHKPAGRESLRNIEVSVSKELLAFSASAAALVEHSRRLQKILAIPLFVEKRGEIFDPPEHRFIIEVRNLISHAEFPDVGWQIQYGDIRRTQFLITPGNLLESEDLHLDSREFILRCDGVVDVGAMAESYANRVKHFYGWYQRAIEGAVLPQLQDYRRIVNRSRTISSRTVHRILLTHYLSAKIDPYKHLDKILLPEQIKTAMTLPIRSKEQVDLIISLADEHGACDEELRGMIYKIFDVR